MAVQTTVGELVFPDGLHFGLSDDSGSTWSDVGVMGNGATFTLNGEPNQVLTGNAGTTAKSFRNMSMAVAPSELYSWDSEVLEMIMGGVFTRTAVAGSELADETDVAAIGYTYEQWYEFDEQQSTGAAPTSISAGQDATVGAGTYGTSLTLNTDYFIVRGTNGAWGYVLTDTETVDNTKATEFTYTVTPASGAYLKAGATSELLTDRVVRFRHYTDTDAGTYDFEVYLYAVTANPGSFVLNKKGANEDGVDTWSIALTADIDESRSDGDQLVAIFMDS